ncbi:MAG: MFS transporter [Spirochaetales bacterium]|uniref:MFS transporter n=1 Tax=Candidatus Thalassospirochaeta sargassi TaxID=3119039 RepID=A0AAJ1MPS8_9SPIO|nr:MFS transporter [Spirochaetales bacterium]
MTELTRRIKWGFGIGDLGGNLFFTLIGFYLLFYLTDIAQLAPALAGTVLMIGKIWDAITDPVTGFLSDRTRTRWGRRRPYMFIGSIIALAAMGLMFTAPGVENQTRLFIYFVFMYCLLNTAYTLVNIPYTAMLPELSSDFDQRTILVGYRMSFAVIGTFVGAGAVLPIVGAFESAEAGWSFMGYFAGFIMLATSFITIWAIREPIHTEVQGDTGFFKTYAQALSNKIFLLALIPWALFILGTSMVQGSLLYYFKYIFNNEGMFQIALIFLLTTSLAFIPVWVKISQRIGKKWCYNIGMGIMTAGVLSFSLAGEAVGVWGAVVIMGLSGLGLSTHYVIPHSILPDVVEHDSIHHGGVRREGVYASLWTFLSKIGQAVALALNGWILALFNYTPDTALTRETITGIKVICGPAPAFFYIIGIFILAFYPISKEYYDRMIAGAREQT